MKTNVLRKIRTTAAILFWLAVTLLFLDFTGTIHTWLGWTAKIQFFPALLALNAGVVIILLLLTLVFGRVYCSVICPLGVAQDMVSWFRGRLKKKKRFRFGFKKERKWLRYGVLAIFIAALVAGIGSFVALLEPYSAYGRMVSNLGAPLWQWCNNLFAAISEHYGSYAFYEKEVWLKSLPTLVIAVLTLVVIFVLAWTGGRSWCNNICPVGTLLGTVSRYSLFRPKINDDKCVGCHLCGRQCKSSCIDTVNHKIDMSRCVTCFDCIDACTHGAISYGLREKKSGNTAVKAARAEAQKPAVATRPEAVKTAADEQIDNGRRTFMAGTAILAGTALAKAQNFGGDGGLAPVLDKVKPQRETRITPPGSISIRHLAQHCTGCQLCVSVCPNNVLRPSTSLLNLMQPEMSYEKGWCRPECTKCSEVCPDGAILKITPEEKTAIHVGHAVVDIWTCITSNGESCGNCARHCPAGAIRLIENEFNPEGPRVPYVNEERCIGCGACEFVCPARPLSAIHVEGNTVHHDERAESGRRGPFRTHHDERRQ